MGLGILGGRGEVLRRQYEKRQKSVIIDAMAHIGTWE